MLYRLYYIILLLFCIQNSKLYAQIDSSNIQYNNKINITNIDSVKTQETKNYIPLKLSHSPQKATIRSAILPGWGQAYNHQYWKIPIIYAAIGTTVGLFIYNLKNYKTTKYAYTVAYNIQNGKDTIGSPTYNAVDDNLKPIIDFPEALRTYRNSFRQNMDYSALFFLIAWGLNVADATVFGHLKNFDIDDNLSLKLVPKYSPFSRTTGISLILCFK